MKGLIFTMAGAAVVAGTATGLAYAATTGDVVHACFQDTHPPTLTHAGKHGNCHRGSIPVTWNRQGLRGKAGKSGLATAGPDGLDVVTVSSQVNVGGEGTVNAQVNCPAGHPYAISGGFDTSSPDVNAAVYLDRPAGQGTSDQDPAGWKPRNTAGGWIVGVRTDAPVILV